MKKNLLKAAAVAFAALLVLAGAQAFHGFARAVEGDDYFDEATGFLCKENAYGTYDIVAYYGPGGDVTIPRTVNDKLVSFVRPDASIQSEVFLYAKESITGIAFPCLTLDDMGENGPIDIGDGVFAGLTNLLTIDLSNSGRLGPDARITGCPNLSGFACDADHPYHASVGGVLFSKDQEELLRYPEAKASTSYGIPEGVESLRSGCFEGCGYLTGIAIPASLESLDTAQFGGCAALAGLTVDGSNPSFSAEGGVLFDKAGTSLLFIAPAKTGAYEIPEAVTSLAPGAFGHARTLTGISIPAGLADLGCSGVANPFAGCTSLAEITVAGSNFTTVGGVLFSSDGTALIAYPAGRAATDPSVYSVKKPGLPLKSTNVRKDIGKIAGAPASSLPKKAYDSLEKAVKNKELPPKDKPEIKPVTNGLGMTGNYIVPDAVTTILDGAFSHTSLAVVTFGASGQINNISSGAFPNDGSVSLSAAYGTSGNPAYTCVKNYCQANGIPFIDTHYQVGDFIIEPIIDGYVEITGYTGNGGDVTIPESINGQTVIRIGDCAFALFFYESPPIITHMAIPNTVTHIGEGAFAGCYDLRGTLKIPDSVTTIGAGCFYGCEGLTTIILPNNTGFMRLEESTFSGCSSLAEIDIPDDVAYIGDCCFEYCSALTEAAIPSGVTQISEDCFYECDSLRSVTLPSGLETLGLSAFDGCESLESIVIPGNVESIGDWCFYGCVKLTGITIPASVYAIGYSVFTYCDSLQYIDVAAGNATFHSVEGALYASAGHALVCYPAGKAGASYTVPEGITRLYGDAFSGNCPLEAIHLTADVIKVGTVYSDDYDEYFISAFQSRNLQQITVEEPNPYFSALDGVLYDNDVTQIICYPPMLPNTTYDIPASITELEAYSMSSLPFETVNIPAALTSIADGAFTYDANLLNINVSSSNTKYASVGGVLCNKAKTQIVAFPGGRTGSYSIPSTVTKIRKFAFEGGSLESVYFHSKVSAIGMMAFEGNYTLRMAVFYGNQYIAGLAEDYDDDGWGIFDNTYYDDEHGDYFTVYYHKSKASSWADYSDYTGYPSQPFVTLTLKFQDGRADAKLVAPVDGGNRIGEPEQPERAGYTFEGWYKDSAYKSRWNFSADTVNGDITLYAKWLSFKVTFNPQGGSSIPSAQVAPNTLAPKPTDPTRTGHTFAGWYREPSCLNAWDFDNDTVQANTTLYAKWTINRYNVTFETVGGSAVEGKTADYNSTIPAPLIPSKEHHTFKGWFKDPACKKAWSFTKDRMPDRDLTLYVKWQPDAFKVSFSSQGGSKVSGKTGYWGLPLSAPKSPKRTGYRFEGWYTDNVEYAHKWTFGAGGDAVTGVTTLYAKWIPLEFTVKLDSRNGQPVQIIEHVPYNTAIAIPETPENGDMVFGGWYTSSRYVTDKYKWNFSNKVTKSFTLYARWLSSGYKVTFSANAKGVTNPSAAYMAYNGLIEEPEPPMREGYFLEGWYTSKTSFTAANKWDFGTRTVKGSVTLYARWLPQQCTVTFNANGGTGAPAKATVGYGDTVEKPGTPPTRAGYFLGGWYTSKTKFTSSYRWDFDARAVKSNVTLYARWVETLSTPKVTAVATADGAVAVSCTAVQYATGYQFYYATTSSSSGQWTQVVSDTPTVSVEGLAAGVRYYFKAKAVCAADAGTFVSNTSSAVSEVPGKPAFLTATATSYNRVHLEWGDVSRYTHFEVWRATSSKGRYSLVCTNPAGETAYDNTVNTGTTYYYKVRAYRLVGKTKVYGAYSAVVPAKCVLGNAANLHVANTDATSVTLGWDALPGATKYEIWRATADSGVFKLLATTSSITCKNEKLVTGQPYYYKVRAYRMVGRKKVYSGFTDVIIGTPTAP